MMKKTKQLLVAILSLSLILAGCQSKNGNNSTINKRDLTFSQETVSFAKQTALYDLPDTLDVYFSDELGKALPYVSLETFFMFLNTEIEKNKDVSNVKKEATSTMFKLSYEYYDEEESMTTTYELAVDGEKQTLYLSEPGALNGLVQSNAYDEENFANISYKDEIVEPAKPVEVSLEKYGVFAYSTQDQLVVPLYFANFLLSGYDLEVANYFDGSQENFYSFAVNDFMEGSTPIDQDFGQVSLSETDFALLKEESSRFLWMLMDEFYGLRLFQSVKSYESDIFNKFNLASSKSQKDYQSSLNEFLFSLNDLHTSTYQNGVMNFNFQVPPNMILSNDYYAEFVNGYQAAKCYDINVDDVTLKAYDFDPSVLYIELYSFDGKVKDELEKVFNENKDKQHVYIDIRCNGGGFVNDVNHVLKYMSADSWQFFSGAMDGSRSISTVTVDEDVFVERKYYLVTSAGTFSAANYLATVVKDEGLATIVGQDSYGGTCSVEVATLADGTIFSRSSSSFCLQNNEFDYVEGGIPVDQKIAFDQIQAADYTGFLKKIVEGSLAK